jgi:hypothetical protein
MWLSDTQGAFLSLASSDGLTGLIQFGQVPTFQAVFALQRVVQPGSSGLLGRVNWLKRLLVPAKLAIKTIDNPRTLIKPRLATPV